MSEVRQEVKTFVVNKTCDKCNKGIMKQIKVNVIQEPITYTHRCSNCENEEILDQSYPRFEYEYITDKEGA